MKHRDTPSLKLFPVQATVVRPFASMGTTESHTEADGADEEQQLSENEPLVIQSGRQAPTDLMMQVLNLSKTTVRTNERLLSGLQVDRKDWEDLKRSVDALHDNLAKVEYR